jgi:nucleolar protein 6
MPSNQPTRLTKKQKKATAFRDRSHKGKGKAILAPGHSRRRPSTGDNLIADGGYDDDDEDALNAVPAMENQALAEMAGCTEGDEDTKTAVGVRTTKENERGKKRDSKKKRRRDDGDARSSAPAAKKAKLVHGSQGAPIITRKEDDTADVEDDGDGSEHESEKTTNKGSKQRYILFIGTSALRHSSTPIQEPERFPLVKGNLKYTTTREAIQNHFSMCGVSLFAFL